MYGQVETLESGEKLKGVHVELIKNGELLDETITKGKGKYSLTIPAEINDAIKVVFRSRGFVSKHITISLKGIHEEDLPEGNIISIPNLSLGIFAENPAHDFFFLESMPVAKMRWDSIRMAMDFDMRYILQMRDRIDNILRDLKVPSN